MVRYIDDRREVRGVEPICKVLPIAPSTYHEHKSRQAKPDRIPARHQREAVLSGEIRRVWNQNFSVYGVRKVWRQLQREGLVLARCTVERLMCAMGLRGAVRGKRFKVTTVPYPGSKRPADLVSRNFTASRPNELWVADLTYVAFVIDTFARMVVGWRASSSMTTELTLDAPGQALWTREVKGQLIHHGDRGSQYLSIRYSERLTDAGVDPSVGSAGDSYDNALAESVIGLFKTEVIRRRSPWLSLVPVEYATLEWVDWFNNRRLLEPIGYMPPAERERAYNAQEEAPALTAGLT